MPRPGRPRPVQADRAGTIRALLPALLTMLSLTTIPRLARRVLRSWAAFLPWRSDRAERAEQRLSLAQDETGVGLFELDYRNGTAYVSPALCEILGQPVTENGSMPLQQWLAALDGGHLEDSRRTLQQKVAAGELRYERELRIARPDGSVHWLLSRIRLDLDERGELVASRGATLDITARKQLVTELEAALMEREQALSMARDVQRRFEVALQSSSVAFTILAPVRDEAGRIVDFAWTYANPAAAALIDRPVDALLGQRVRDVLPHAWDEPGFFERYVQVSEQGITAEFETQSSGRVPARWLHVILSPLDDSVVVWFADVTQRREQQQALQDADRRKDQFLATLAHELRNPLAPIRHAAAVLRDPAVDAAKRSWSIAVIERQLQHMALLLDDLLDVSRITRGTLPLRRVHGALQPIIDTAVETARPLFDTHRHRLTVQVPAEPVWLDVDPLRIAQVLGNLLVNAAKYTPAGGAVTLDVRVEADEVVIAVIDNGQGLRADDCERVFEMFTQLPAAEAGVTGGLGIGLALARNLVRLHGGRLDARSAGPGQGSTFTLRLPATAPPVAMAEPPTPQNAAAAGSPRRILVADDNRDAADSLAMLLGLQGHAVRIAYDGIEALAHYDGFRPHIAVLDMGMPGHSGAEVAAQIRRRPHDAPIMLIAVTGFGQPGDRRLALDAGFDHHLTKPIRVEELEALITGSNAAVR
jgi:PAS domain S-box-containing protein